MEHLGNTDDYFAICNKMKLNIPVFMKLSILFCYLQNLHYQYISQKPVNCMNQGETAFESKNINDHMLRNHCICNMSRQEQELLSSVKDQLLQLFIHMHHNLTSIQLSEGYFQDPATSSVLLTTFFSLSKIISLGRGTNYCV